MKDNAQIEFKNLDLSAVEETLSQIREMIRPAEANFQALYEVLRPINEAISKLKPFLDSIATGMKLVDQYLQAASMLGENQYICWDYLSSSFVHSITSSDNVNEALLNYLEPDVFEQCEATIQRTSADAKMKPHIRLYDESAKAFHCGFYDLAVTGFTAVFDGILSSISCDTTPKLKKRIKTINDKLITDVVLDHSEYATITLSVTFEKTMELFSMTSDFNMEEPNALNRHWIAHGRSTREKTKLDCVKMINMIYGLLLIAKLEIVDSNTLIDME